jgi:hypothetical protein
MVREGKRLVILPPNVDISIEIYQLTLRFQEYS